MKPLELTAASGTEKAHNFPSAFSQIFVILAVALFALGVTPTFRGVATLQTFIITQPCDAGRTANCCHRCLGLSEAEYGGTLGFASWFALPVIFFIGAVTDSCGLPSGLFALASIAFAGALLQAASVYLRSHHVVVVLLTTVAKTGIEIAGASVGGVSQYVASRYWPKTRRPFAYGLLFSMKGVAGVISGFVLPRLAFNFGLDSAFWVAVIGTVASLMSAICLGVFFKTSSEMLQFETQMKEDSTQECSSVIPKNFSSCELEYWLIATAIGTIDALNYVTAVNTQLIQVTLLHLSPLTVAANQSIAWLVQALLVPILGYLLMFVPFILIVTFVSIGLLFVSMVLLIIPHGSGLASYILFCIAAPMVIMSLLPLMNDYVPRQSLGKANSFINSYDMLNFGIFSIVLGHILNQKPILKAAYFAVFFLMSVLTVPLLNVILLVWRRRSDCKKLLTATSEKSKLLESPEK